MRVRSGSLYLLMIHLDPVLKLEELYLHVWFRKGTKRQPLSTT